MQFFRLSATTKQTHARVRGWHRWAVVIFFALISCGCERPKPTPTLLQQILARGELRVGSIYSDTTFFYGPDGPQGYEYELAQEFADYLGVELKMVPVYTLVQLFELLENGSADLLASGLTITPNRAERYSFGPQYMTVSQKVVYRNGEQRPRNLGELQGKLEVVAGSSFAEELDELKLKHSNLEWSETREFEVFELMERVINGDIAYTIADSAQISQFRHYHPELAVAFTLNRDMKQAWMFNKQPDDELLSVLIDFFGRRQASGDISSLEERYFGHIRGFNYVDVKAFIKAIDNRLPKYRAWFEKYAEEFDWRLIASQSYQESHWKPNAKSFTGVRGLMMVTQATAKRFGVDNRLDPEQSIRGGVAYLRHLYNRIPDSVDEAQRPWFALAAYNVGLGHLRDAMKITELQGGNPNNWSEVKETLPLLRKKAYYQYTRFGYARGDEPVKYVDNIRRYYETLVYIDNKRAQETALQYQREKFGKLDSPIKTSAEPEPVSDDTLSEPEEEKQVE